MRIVVFTCNYPPLTNPRSFRIGKFKKLNYENNEILIITSPVIGAHDIEKNVIRCGLKLNVAPQLRNSLKNISLFRFLHKFIWPDDKLFHQLLYLINYLFKYREKEDLIITVSNPFSSHLIGLVLNKFWKHKWITDIGDNYYGNQHKTSISQSFERNVLYNSNHIVVNSNSLRNYFIQHYKLSSENVTIIPNGIHLDISKIEKSTSGILRLSYIGNTYQEVREAVSELIILIKIAKDDPNKKMRIQLFGNQFLKINELGNNYPDLIQINYCNNNDELIRAYSNTDLLLNFANKNNPGLPSKLEEYLASGIPIVNFIYSEQDPSFNFLKSYSNPVYHCNLNYPDTKSLYEFILRYAGKRFPNASIPSEDEKIRSMWNSLIEKLE